MKYRIFYAIIFFFAFKATTFAQIGGKNVYSFVNLPNSARVTALGGNLIGVRDEDAALAYQNPALLNGTMHRQLHFSHNFYYNSIAQGYVGYAFYASRYKATFHTAIQYIDYGDFDLSNVQGQKIGTFEAGEYALNMGAGLDYSDRLSMGVNLKTVFSNLESYRSVGLMTDLGLTYRDTANQFVMSFVIKNLGGQLTTYEGERERVPFDVQVGFSKRLRYLPFRVSVTAHDLYRWDVRYDDPNVVSTTTLFGEPAEAEKPIGEAIDNVFRHLIFGGELLLGEQENVRLRVGYNHLRRAELSVNNTVSFAGFSMGAGIKINRFRIDFGRTAYHLAGGTNHLAISTTLAKRKK